MICREDSIQTVSNQQHCSAGKMFAQGGANIILQIAIQRVHRFVENEQLRITKYGPRKPEPLALAAREPQSLLADPVFISVGKSLNHFGQSGHLNGLRDLRVGRLSPRHQNIVFQGPLN